MQATVCHLQGIFLSVYILCTCIVFVRKLKSENDLVRVGKNPEHDEHGHITELNHRRQVKKKKLHNLV